MRHFKVQPSLTVGRGVIIELLRRKDMYVLGMLILVFCIGAVSGRMVGIQDAVTGTFLLNLGMSLSHIFAHILTLLLAVRQVPAEIENRTIYPILARPVTRSQFLVGKWGACTLAGMVSYLGFFMMVWLSTPKLEAYDGGLLTQTLTLQIVSLALTAALGICFSLLMPKGMALILAGILLFFGSLLTGFVRSAAEATSLEGLFNWVVLYLPDFSKLNLITRYTDGIWELTPGVFLGAACHGLFYTWMALVVGCWSFGRRSI